MPFVQPSLDARMGIILGIFQDGAALVTHSQILSTFQDGGRVKFPPPPPPILGQTTDRCTSRFHCRYFVALRIGVVV